ncbi:MAG: chemotaxis protein CheW, partial [Candidatus Omnitrophica bacterium]|nr:chemotaxis protein CheW [Candidatus Omnitrophota bacterium]
MTDPQKIIIDIDDDDFEEKERAKKDVVRFLLFRLGSEHYCAPIDQVKEVIVVPDLTRVPLTPEFVVGVINLRGEII